MDTLFTFFYTDTPSFSSFLEAACKDPKTTKHYLFSKAFLQNMTDGLYYPVTFVFYVSAKSASNEQSKVLPPASTISWFTSHHDCSNLSIQEAKQSEIHKFGCFPPQENLQVSLFLQPLFRVV